ncbi:MAG TPA: hypothetical protein QGI71_08990 [Dehalococcoidia bacterium]|jgi:hypothetical protein|nr:hypothetical protein [Dehalococcoidia bacterium]
MSLTATLARLRRLVALDLAVLDDVRHDSSATVWALVVATASMAMLGGGGWLWWVFSGFGNADSVLFKTVLLGTLAGVLLWLVWLLVVYALVQRLTGVITPVEQLVRAAGFATFPLMLGIFMAVPAISFGVGLVALGGWLLVTQEAVERATGAPVGVAILANLAGFAAWVLLMALLTTASNQLGPGPLLAESLWESISGYEGGRALLGN